MQYIGFAAMNCRDDAGEIWLSVDVMPGGDAFQSEGYGGAAAMRRLGYEIVSIGEFVARKRELASAQA
jgi:hypothetical protein